MTKTEKEAFLILQGWTYYDLPFDENGQPNGSRLWRQPEIKSGVGTYRIIGPKTLDEAYAQATKF